MCQAYRAQARHRKRHKAFFEAVMVAVAGALIGVMIFYEALLATHLRLTAFALGVGALGVVLLAKYCERTRLRIQRSQASRRAQLRR